MPDGDDWIYDPIPKGYYSLTDVYEGKVDLLAVARANDHMIVKAANERLARERLKDGR